MRLLGAVLAGGRSTRFGSDKALAKLGDTSLIDRVIAALEAQCTAIVICGRDMPGRVSLADRPGANLGPLGGLCAALDYAQRHGFEAVLTAPCDTPNLPTWLAERLGADLPAFAASAPVVGCWPAALAGQLDAHLASSDDRSMRRWASLSDARAVDIGEIGNVNTVDDLRRLGDG